MPQPEVTINERNTFEVLKVKQQSSYYGKSFYYVFMKCRENGSSWKTAVYPSCRNFGQWDKLLYFGTDEQRNAEYNPGIILYNLRQLFKNGLAKKGFIDADSIPGKLDRKAVAPVENVQSF